MARPLTLAQSMRRWGERRAAARARAYAALEAVMSYRETLNDPKRRELMLSIFELEQVTAEAARRSFLWSSARKAARR